MAKQEWIIEDGVRCVVCPACAFTFAAIHTDEGATDSYSCPACAEITLAEKLGRLYDDYAALVTDTARRTDNEYVRAHLLEVADELDRERAAALPDDTEGPE